MAKIRIITFGCSNNAAESEMMAGLLKGEHRIVEKGEEICIVNACSVKGPSFNKALKAIRKAKAKVIAAGCIPDYGIAKILSLRKDASIVTTHNIGHIKEAVNCVISGGKAMFAEHSSKVKIYPRLRHNPAVAIIPISSGCTGACSYCAVKAIKGELLSYPPERIAEEARRGVEEGCKELWITAQDTGCYGMDIGTDLPSLLKKIAGIEGCFRIRLGMANPNFVLKHIDSLVEAFRNEKMFKFLHIPLQSGANRILKLMNRKYTKEQFIEIVQRFRKDIPEITIATDIIVGFPGEREEEFRESIDMIKAVKPDVLNLNRFWAMPNTEAAKMKALPSEILKERSLRMLSAFHPIALERNKRWIGWQGKAIIDEQGKNQTFVGRNDSYKPIVVKGKLKLGDIVELKAEKATAHDLRAVVMKEEASGQAPGV